MAVDVRCQIASCKESMEAEHWEDARDKVRAHFRMEHPTKVLNENSLSQDFINWNLTLDEYLDSYWGEGWRDVQPPITDEQLVTVCRSLRRSWQGYNPKLIQEAIELAHERGTELDPFDPANPGPGGNAPVNGRFIPLEVFEEPPFDPAGGF